MSDLATSEMVLNMGPQHPSTHGVLRIIVTLDGEMIVRAIPDIGFLHRGIEKISETWRFHQIPIMADRADYLSAFNTEFALMLAAERLWGVQVPERAEYVRVILAELNRIASHLMFYGSFGADAGFSTPFTYAFRLREVIQDVFEEVSGARLLHNYLALGGLKYDVPQGFKQMVLGILPEIEAGIDECDRLLTDNEVLQARTKGLNPLSTEEAIRQGITGPTLRSTGLKRDLRRLVPYSVYEGMDFEIPIGSTGDVFERYLMRLLEMRQSVRIVRHALAQTPDEGSHRGEIPRVLRLPQGEAYARTESPRGDLCIFLVGTGEAVAHRVKIRAPAFTHAGALEALLPGYYVADCVLIIGSMDIVLGEIDR